MSVTLRECAESLVAGGALAPTASAIEQRLQHYLRAVQAEEYTEAYTQLRADKTLSDSEKKALIDAVNHSLLFGRDLEWGNHGMRRSFRFWSEVEKRQYLLRALQIVECLKRNFTPFVTFGFGSVLGMIRDNDFIPHDDDMDLLIAFPRDSDASFAKAKLEIQNVLLREGYWVPENNMRTHHTVAKGPWAGTDIFIGFIDPGERISWFPSKRGGLHFSEVFPTATFELFGVACPVPAQPERYLEVTYGSDWRSPIPNWNHPWHFSEYQDLAESAQMPLADQPVILPEGMAKRLIDLVSQAPDVGAELNEMWLAKIRDVPAGEAAIMPVQIAEWLSEIASRAPGLTEASNIMLLADVYQAIDEAKQAAS